MAQNIKFKHIPVMAAFAAAALLAGVTGVNAADVDAVIAPEPVPGLLYFTPRNTNFELNLGQRKEDCSFISPEVSGASCYSFDAESAGDSEADSGLQDSIALGIAYQNRVKDIDLDLSTTVVSSAPDGEGLGTVNTELPSWKLDFSAGYTGFTFSTSFAEKRSVGETKREDFSASGGQEVFDLGVKYDQGPWVLGVQYSHSQLDTLSIGPQIGDQKVDAYEIGGSYLMGPRLSLGAAIQFWKWDEIAGASVDEDHQSDLLFLIGSHLKF